MFEYESAVCFGIFKSNDVICAARAGNHILHGASVSTCLFKLVYICIDVRTSADIISFFHNIFPEYQKISFFDFNGNGCAGCTIGDSIIIYSNIRFSVRGNGEIGICSKSVIVK